MRLPLGTTEWNHSYYTASSLSAQMSASTRVSHGAAPSSSVSCPQVTLSAAHPQVQMDPTRTITSDLLSATLAEAATRLSFAAFLERCIFVNASPPPQLPVPTPSLDAATQTFSHTVASQDVSTQLSFRKFLASPSTHDVLCPTCARPVLPRYLLMRLCRRPYTASQLMMPPHNYRSRSSSSGASSPMTLRTAKLCHRHIAILVAPHRLNLLTLLRFAAPAAPAMLATVTSTLRLHMSYCSHHRVSRRMPFYMLHMVYLLKRHRCDLVCVHLSQSRPHSHMSVPP